MEKAEERQTRSNTGGQKTLQVYFLWKKLQGGGAPSTKTKKGGRKTESGGAGGGQGRQEGEAPKKEWRNGNPPSAKKSEGEGPAILSRKTISDRVTRWRKREHKTASGEETRTKRDLSEGLNGAANGRERYGHALWEKPAPIKAQGGKTKTKIEIGQAVASKESDKTEARSRK